MIELGHGTIDTMLGRRAYRVTGPPQLGEIQTPEGRADVLGRMAADVWMRWAQANDDEHEYPPSIEEIRANLERQAHWVAVFADPTI